MAEQEGSRQAREAERLSVTIGLGALQRVHVIDDLLQGLGRGLVDPQVRGRLVVLDVRPEGQLRVPDVEGAQHVAAEAAVLQERVRDGLDAVQLINLRYRVEALLVLDHGPQVVVVLGQLGRAPGRAAAPRPCRARRRGRSPWGRRPRRGGSAFLLEAADARAPVVVRQDLGGLIGHPVNEADVVGEGGRRRAQL